MCRNCRSAGDVNAIGTYNVARTLHNTCDYPQSCTCQHGTGHQWVQHAR
jgi:hypothetical protein